MKKTIKIFFLAGGLIPALSFAQSQAISLNTLLEISERNFCYQQNNNVIKDMNNFFNMNNESLTKFIGQQSKIEIQKTILDVNETNEHLKEELFKFDKKKYPIAELNKVVLDNIYTLNFSANIEIPTTPVQSMILINKYFPGMNFKNDNYSGQYVLAKGVNVNFANVDNVKQLKEKLSKAGSSVISFTITKNPTNNASIIAYNCQMTVLTPQSPQGLAHMLSSTIE